MSAETEKILKDVGHVTNDVNKWGKIVNPATRYLRHNERESRKKELRRLEQMLSRQNVYETNLGEESRAQAMTHAARLQQDLEEHSPPTNLSPETKDALYKELKREEEIYKVGLLSYEEMRRNRVGAVDRHLAHDKANKARALKIKNLRLALNPDSDAQDLCNLEDLRSSTARQDGTSQFHVDAQIPGVFAMTPKAKENWPEGLTEYPENSPLMQAERTELERLRAEVAALKETKTKPKMGMSAEKRAEQSAKMKARWAARKAKNETTNEVA